MFGMGGLSETPTDTDTVCGIAGVRGASSYTTCHATTASASTSAIFITHIRCRYLRFTRWVQVGSNRFQDFDIQRVSNVIVPYKLQ